MATVRKIGGRECSGPSESIASISLAVCSAPGRSALLMTNMSAISMVPALMACTSSPMPGTSTTSVASAEAAISVSACPAPHRFHDHEIEPGAAKQAGDIATLVRASPPLACQRSGHGANEDSGIAMMALHADAIAQNCTAGGPLCSKGPPRRRRLSWRAVGFLYQRVDKRTLPYARGARDTGR